MKIQQTMYRCDIFMIKQMHKWESKYICSPPKKNAPMAVFLKNYELQKITKQDVSKHSWKSDFFCK